MSVFEKDIVVIGGQEIRFKWKPHWWFPFSAATTTWPIWRKHPHFMIPKAWKAQKGQPYLTSRHELRHVPQWEHFGRLGFLRRYLFDKTWRLVFEADGYAESIRARMALFNGLSTDIEVERYAKGHLTWVPFEKRKRALEMWLGNPSMRYEDAYAALKP